MEPWLSIEEIKKRGKKMGLNYLQSLSLWFYEEILRRVSHSEWKDRLWLREERHNTSNRIVFFISQNDPHLSHGTIHDGIQNILRKRFHQNYHLVWQILYVDRQIEVALTVWEESVKLNFKILIRPVWIPDVYPSEASYISRFTGEESIYKKYPLDLELAECLYEIMDKLELIPDLSAYAKSYEIISQEPVEGRRVCMELSRLLKEFPILSEKKRWDTVAAYKDYPYMRNRWKKFLRQSKKKEPVWEDVITLLHTFYLPLRKAIDEEEIFFGDWMPHLGRYLD